VKAGEDTVELDLGFGTIVVSLCDSAIKYRFVPDK